MTAHACAVAPLFPLKLPGGLQKAMALPWLIPLYRTGAREGRLGDGRKQGKFNKLRGLEGI
jgi:hypothetical protein